MMSFLEDIILSLVLIYWKRRVTSFSSSIYLAVAFLNLYSKLLIFFYNSII